MIESAIVIGAGIVGASCARSLAKLGVEVTVVERGAVASGTTASGEGNLLVSDKAPGPELAMALHATALWPSLVAELSEELGLQFPHMEYEPKGGVVVATTEVGAAPLLEFAASQRVVGVQAEVLSAADALRLEPDLNPAITAAIFYPQDSQVQPLIAAEALLASAKLHGARILQNATVTGPVYGADGSLAGITKDGGTLRADAVVVAAGPWSGEVAQTLGILLPVHPRRGVVLVTSRMRHRVFHKVYDADYIGAVASDDSALQTSSVVESTAAGTVLIGSSRERIGFDASMRTEVMAQIAAKALRLFPFLADHQIIRAYGGFRPFMPDHLPLIGPDHRLQGLWHATGHEGAGIGLAPVTGDLIAAMMTGTEPGLDISPYSLARASLAPFLVEAA